jgi:hypothetical protein
MSQILNVSDDGQLRVRLVTDHDCPNPRRENDCLGHAVTVPSRDYVDVDKNAGPLAEGWDRIKDRPDAMDLFERWARAFHGAMTLRDIPERGASAVWYILPGTDATDPAEYLKGEAQVYREWAAGETYGYVIEESVSYVEVGGDRSRDDWEEVEDGSLYGLIGFTHARDTALAALEEHITTRA